MAEPILKYVGGKRRLLPELMPRLPARFERYYEPFVGGAALFLHLAPERAVIADFNADLVELYRTLASDVEAVVEVLSGLQVNHREHGDAAYYLVRDGWNEQRAQWSPAERAAALVYLNKTCFNGLWRVNRAGKFNVPAGRYANPRICDPAALRAAAAVLARAEIRAGDYRETVADAGEGDLVYFDPPYVPATPTSNFTSYTARGFGLQQQRELAQTARDLVARGASVVLSNSDVPLVRELYEGFQLDEVECARAINSDGNKRGAVGELIIRGAR